MKIQGTNVIEIIQNESGATMKLNGEEMNLDHVVSINVDIQASVTRVTLTTVIFATDIKVDSEYAEIMSSDE
jgi:hypothetical protein